MGGKDGPLIEISAKIPKNQTDEPSSQHTTLIMLVSAFAGREQILSAYELAVKEGYRFYSFGDAMFIF